MDDVYDYSGLEARLLHPDRQPSNVARATMARPGDLATARADLAGTGPDPDTDNRRRFRHQHTCPACRGKGSIGGYDNDGDWEDGRWGCSACAGRGHRPDSPVTATPGRDHLLAFAADAHGTSTAETLARTAAWHLRPWGLPAPAGVVWRVGGPLASLYATNQFIAGAPRQSIEVLADLLTHCWAVELADATQTITLDQPYGTRAVPHLNAQAHAELHARWHAARARGYHIPAHYLRWNAIVDLSDHPLTGRALTDLPDPFTPILDIWHAGYALDGVQGSDLLLYAPSI